MGLELWFSFLWNGPSPVLRLQKYMADHDDPECVGEKQLQGITRK